MSRRLLPLGVLVAAAAAYVLFAWAAPPGFFDGLQPPAPYRWVHPPAALRAGNQPPLAGHSTILLGPGGTVPTGIAFTRDGQASASWQEGAFRPLPGRTAAIFRIAAQASYPDPGRMRLSTNVYCFTSTASLVPGRDVYVTLTYSGGIHPPTGIYTYAGSGPWRKLTGRLQALVPYGISALSPTLACFGAGWVPAAGGGVGPLGTTGRDLPVLTAALLLLVLVLALPLIVLRRRSRSR